MIGLSFLISLFIFLLNFFIPCIIKLVFRDLKKYDEFFHGLGCLLISGFVDFVLIILLFLSMYFIAKHQLEKIIETYKNYKEIINSDELIDMLWDLWNLSKVFVIFLIGSLIALVFINYMILFGFIKRMAKNKLYYCVVFMYISGNVFPYSFFYLPGIFTSLNPDESKSTDDTLKKTLYFHGILAAHVLSMAGAEIMIFIFHLTKSKFIFAINIITFFGPITSFIIGLCINKVNQITYFIIIGFDLASFFLGVYFYPRYCKESDDDSALTSLSKGTISPQYLILPD